MMEARLDFLRSAQNADGGWGFFPGKQSWVEPTAYALIAMQGAPGYEAPAERGWKLLRSLQLPDGSWPASAAVPEPHWTTALAVTLHGLRGVSDEPFRRGVAWLLDTVGIENGWQFRIAHFLRPSVVELDPSFEAWPWLPGNSSWIEPTAHALVALKKTAKALDDPRLRDRISQGEKMILDRRCSDGGWNYGNRKVLGVDLPSYPETTALALIGLAGRSDLAGPLALAQLHLRTTRSPLAKAWLRVALRSHSVPMGPPVGTPLSPNDVIVNALEVIAAAGAIA
jgi:hypothetical protein